jgi:serine/threonine-protein kinase
MLQAVDVAGSPSRTHDEEVIRGARVLGAGYEGLRYVVRSAELASADGDVATVRARVDTSAYAVVRTDGTRQARASTAGIPVTITLRWTADGWRIHR